MLNQQKFSHKGDWPGWPAHEEFIFLVIKYLLSVRGEEV